MKDFRLRSEKWFLKYGSLLYSYLYNSNEIILFPNSMQAKTEDINMNLPTKFRTTLLEIKVHQRILKYYYRRNLP